MAGTVQVTVALSVTLAGDVTGNLTNPTAITFTLSPEQRVQLALVNGFNQLVPPVGTRGLIIVPPQGSANGKTLKGVTGDTGVPLDPANWSFFSLPTNPGNLGITSVGPETIVIYWV